jgi:hypothetical protein
LVGLLVLTFAAGGMAIRTGCARPPDLPPATAGPVPDGPGVRPEESTYLTFPEWYIVYAAREEAGWLRRGPPSGFPYLAAVGQFWCGYAAVYDVTRARYGFNADDHLMLVVIGASTTAEYAGRALYEGSVGRASEAVGGWRSDEDRFADDLAAEYAAFMDLTPWYEFPFGARLAALWRLPAWGESPARKWERRLWLSGQLAGKAAYGWAIGTATHAMYGEEDATTMAQLADGRAVPLPRYAVVGPLTELLRGGAEVRALGGNREVMVTLLAPRRWRYDLPVGTVLLEQPLLVDRGRKRLAVSLPVAGLGRVLVGLDRPGVELEHLYDY